VGFSDFQGERILLYVHPAQGDPIVLSSLALERPGPFMIPLLQQEPVVLQVILDRTRDGRDPGDRTIDLSASVFHAEQKLPSSVVLDLDQGEIRASW